VEGRKTRVQRLISFKCSLSNSPRRWPTGVFSQLKKTRLGKKLKAARDRKVIWRVDLHFVVAVRQVVAFEMSPPISIGPGATASTEMWYSVQSVSNVPVNAGLAD